MKTKTLFFCLIASIISISINAQGFTKPSEGKAVIYIIYKTVGASTQLIFDGDKLIGTLKMDQYLRYECKPGNHIFIGSIGMQKGFLTVEMEEGKIYIVKMRVEEKLGGVAPYFKFIDFNKENQMKKMTKLVNSKAPAEMDPAKKDKWAKRWKKPMAKAIIKFKTKLKKKNKHQHISADMDYKI